MTTQSGDQATPASTTWRWTDPSRPAWLRVLGLAWPAFLQQMLLLTVNLTDRWLAGNALHLEGDQQLSLQGAQTTCFYLAWVVTCYGVLASVGASAIVSRQVGAGDPAGANLACHQSLLLAFALGVAGGITGLFGIDSLLVALQLEGLSREFAFDYLSVTLALLPCQLLLSTAVASLAGAGDTRTGLWVLGGTTVANLPLAWLGFRGLGNWPGLGFAGIAWGTGLSHSLGTLAVLLILWRGKSGLRLHARLFRPHRAMLVRLMRVSLPAGADSLTLAAGQLLFLAIINLLDDASQGAHGIALGWEALGYLSGAAFGIAATTLVGQNLGAGQPAQARLCGFTAFGMGAVAMSCMGVIFYTLAEPMFLFFCPRPEQAAVVAVGVPVLRLVAFSMPMLASCIILTSALRGAGDTRFPLLFTWVGFFVVRLPLAWWLSRTEVHIPGLISFAGWDLGLFGCWLAMQIDINLRGALCLARFLGGKWQKIRV
ncbi:MAG: MATE family efflux transporter [Planctomycetota bacterium]|nr:MATE family efflux transporter [Planctomycetota bacterium]